MDANRLKAQAMQNQIEFYLLVNVGVEVGRDTALKRLGALKELLVTATQDINSSDGRSCKVGATSLDFQCTTVDTYIYATSILSREYHASALTGRKRLLFRVREREHAAVVCLPRLRNVTSRIRNLAQPGTDVMRDVLRLVDVDLLRNCNGHSTIPQADNLLRRVVRHGGLRTTSA